MTQKRSRSFCSTFSQPTCHYWRKGVGPKRIDQKNGAWSCIAWARNEMQVCEAWMDGEATPWNPFIPEPCAVYLKTPQLSDTFTPLHMFSNLALLSIWTVRVPIHTPFCPILRTKQAEWHTLSRSGWPGWPPPHRRQPPSSRRSRSGPSTEQPQPGRARPAAKKKTQN